MQKKIEDVATFLVIGCLPAAIFLIYFRIAGLEINGWNIFTAIIPSIISIYAVVFGFELIQEHHILRFSTWGNWWKKAFWHKVEFKRSNFSMTKSQEMIKWANENTKGYSILDKSWYMNMNEAVIIYFRYRNDALLFKLTWAGE